MRRRKRMNMRISRIKGADPGFGSEIFLKSYNGNPEMATRFASIACLICAVMAHAATLSVRSYTVADGLANNHVSRIYRDSHDFLWICTDEGLSRFDGLHFVNFTPADGLPDIHVNDIIETRRGDYWIGTDGGLVLFRPASHGSRFVIFDPPGPERARLVNAVLEDHDGSLLVGTSAGLYRLRFSGSEASFEHIDFHPPPDFPGGSMVNTLLIDQDDALWVGASSGLYRRDTNGNWIWLKQREGLPHDFVDRLVTDSVGRIWACTRHGLARLATRVEEGKQSVDKVLNAENGLPHSDVRGFLAISDNHRWIATLAGLVEWRPGSHPEFRTYTQRDGVSDQELSALALDPAGQLWAGTRNGGLNQLRERAIQSIGAPKGVLFSYADRVLETPSGRTCVSSTLDPRRTIRCFDGSRVQTIQPRLPLQVVRTTAYPDRATLVDHSGRWWIATNGGLFRLKQIQPRSRIEPSFDLRLLPDRESRRVFEDSNGTLWITTLRLAGERLRWAYGLFRWTPTTDELHDFSSYLPDKAREREVTSIAETADGEIWIGLGQPGGLFRLRADKFEEVHDAPTGTIKALLRDRQGRLWIASSQSGLGRIDDPSSAKIEVRRYGRKDGLSSDQIWCLVEDSSGRIFMGTARGVDRLDPVSGEVMHLTTADGLPPGDIRSAAIDLHGDLWFLTSRGLAEYRPQFAIKPARLETRIMGLRVGGVAESISANGETDIHLGPVPWYRNSVQVNFGTVDFVAPEKVRFQVYLEGGAPGWSVPSSVEEVQFSNLAHGSYRVLVRVVPVFGLMDTTPAVVSFSISPPIWERWWFIVLATAVALSLLFLWHRTYLNRRLDLERVRSQIAIDLHDDIGASLSRIAVMSEAIKARMKSDDSSAFNALGEIAETSRAVVDGMSDIVWSVDPRRDNLGDVVARLRAFGSGILEPKAVCWTCEEVSGAGAYELSLDQRRQLYLIGKEAINNVARHSGASIATLRIELRESHLRMEIEDNGCGIQARSSAGLGLKSMRMRAARLGGTVEVSENDASGVRVTLFLSLKKVRSA
jgi:ligand-binding sensor domain-containing protein/signal transduction histidine kinase